MGWSGAVFARDKRFSGRLRQQGILSPGQWSKKATWSRSTIWAKLRNPAYKGTAIYGKTSNRPLKRQRLRPHRGKPEHPRSAPISRVNNPADDQISIEVPGVGER